VRLDAHFDTTISEIKIDEKRDWRKKHLRSIMQNYSRVAEFDRKFHQIAGVFESKTDNLAALCYDQLTFWLAELGITTPIVRASELPVSGRKSDLLLKLCSQVGATTYLCGPLRRGYLQEDSFSTAGIKIE
jgi:hypothetical protein